MRAALSRLNLAVAVAATLATGAATPVLALTQTITAPAPAHAPTPVPAPAPTPAPEPIASASLKTADGSPAGTVTVFQGPMGAIFHVEGMGWPTGWHAVHLHAVGTCDGPGFTSAGGHVNHMGQARPHGLLNDDGGSDLGDLQNVYAAADGSVHADVYLATSGLDAKPDDYMDADGLSFVVHANADDYVSQPIGGAGARIACGVFTPAP